MQFLPLETDLSDQTLVLSEPVLGFQIMDTEDDRRIHGSLSEIPAGSGVTLCGRGFADRAVKVLANGRYYFVFRRDLQCAEE
jgi:hypothetical protein